MFTSCFCLSSFTTQGPQSTKSNQKKKLNRKKKEQKKKERKRKKENRGKPDKELYSSLTGLGFFHNVYCIQ
jgi:hypothetical protein